MTGNEFVQAAKVTSNEHDDNGTLWRFATEDFAAETFAASQEEAAKIVAEAYDGQFNAPTEAPLEDRLVAALEALPPDRVVSASELLAIIRGV